MSKVHTEAAQSVDFSHIRYAQVWEDADILLEGLDINKDATCVSICSAGDNALAMLSKSPAKVYAVDLNPAQIHCLNLRIAAFKCLSHRKLLEFIGSRDCSNRINLYDQCKRELPDDARAYWDSCPELIQNGIGSAGKFERYFATFRNKVLPLVHTKKRIDSLLQQQDRQGRVEFYNSVWDNWRWRLLFNIFFSRTVMGKLGRDPAFFKYVEGSVADRILERAHHALTELDTSENPYLQWILKGQHTTALPNYLREENFETIRANIDRIEPRLCTLEELCDTLEAGTVNAFNLSDIFEYMSEENTEALLKRLVSVSAKGSRLAYWNMLAPRSRPESMASSLIPQEELSQKLFLKDKAFFYSRFVVEEVSG